MFKSASLVLALCVLTANAGDREVRCSSKLNEMMSFLCADVGFNNLIPHKRSSLDPLDPLSFVAENEVSNELLPYPLANERLRSIYAKGLNSLTTTRRRQRGIVDECCRQSCTVNELMSYCAVPL